MKRHRLAAIRGLIAGLAAVLIACTGSVTPASATTTYWTFNDYAGTCLTASATTTTVFTDTCHGWQSQDWDWVGSSYNGQTQLMSRTTGLCLTTKNTSGRNGVWLSRCGYDTGQFWNYAYLYTSLTYHTLMSDAGLDCVFCSLRMSPGYTSVYSSDFIADEEDYNIPLTAHMWNGTTHS